MPDIKYMPRGNDSRVALCSVCRSKKDVREKMAQVKQPVVQGKKPYYCERCNYKFKFDPKLGTGLKCPYCGKADAVEEYKDLSADSLLKEVSGRE
mgnify:CR=1 FL=1